MKSKSQLLAEEYEGDMLRLASAVLAARARADFEAEKAKSAVMIVRQVASDPEPRLVIDDANAWCRYCGQSPTGHVRLCPWRQAREWVEAND